MASAVRLVETGIAPELALELAAQITAGVGKRVRLVELGMVPPAASEVAAQIGGVANAGRLVELGVDGMTAQELARQISAGGVAPPAPAFTSSPTITPASGNTATTYSAPDPTITNGSIAARQWYLNGNPFSTDATIVPGTGNAGALTRRYVGAGLDGSTIFYTTPAATVSSTITPSTGILATGVWNDAATWDDTQAWKDAA